METSNDHSTFKNLLAQIDYEIERIDKDAVITGATPWVLSAALGAVMWLLSSELANKELRIQDVLLFTVAGSILWDFFFVYIRTHLSSKKNDYWPHPGRIKTTKSLFSDGRLFLAFWTIRNVLLATLVFYLGSTLRNPYLYFTGVFYSYLSIDVFALFILSSIDIPLGYQIRSARITASPLYRTGFYLAFIYAAYHPLYHIDISLPSSIYPTRVAALIIVVVFLLGRLCSAKRYGLYGSLVSLRRDLAGERLTVNEAKAAFDTIIAGSTFSDYMAPDIERIVDGYMRGANKTKECREKLELARSIWEAQPMPRKEDVVEVRRIVAPLEEMMMAIDEEMEEQSRLQQKFDSRVLSLVRWIPDLNVGPVLESMTGGVEMLKEETSKAKAEAFALLEALTATEKRIAIEDAPVEPESIKTEAKEG